MCWKFNIPGGLDQRAQPSVKSIRRHTELHVFGWPDRPTAGLRDIYNNSLSLSPARRRWNHPLSRSSSDGGTLLFQPIISSSPSASCLHCWLHSFEPAIFFFASGSGACIFYSVILSVIISNRLEVKTGEREREVAAGNKTYSQKKTILIWQLLQYIIRITKWSYIYLYCSLKKKKNCFKAAPH